MRASKVCPKCGAEGGDDDAFCENDGAALQPTGAAPAKKPARAPAPEPLSPERMGATRRVRAGKPAASAPAAGSTNAPTSCPSCHAKGSDDGDGYCNECGHKLEPSAGPAPRPPTRRSLEEALRAHQGPLARADIAEDKDPGLVRDHQQDATAIAEGSFEGQPWVILALCDGVSSSTKSGPAAALGSRTARDALAHFIKSGDIGHELIGPAVGAAIRAAHLAICGEIPGGGDDAPGATIVVALVFAGRVTVGWLGDSRAYWITGKGITQLTKDHSWVNEALARGEIQSAEGVDTALAHTITKCIGPLEVDGAVKEVTPEVMSRELGGPGTLVLCSDGLWNEVQDDEIGALVRGEEGRANAPSIARLLVTRALTRGGHDNVSVAVHTHDGGFGGRPPRPPS